jgi:hypothetical protein
VLVLPPLQLLLMLVLPPLQLLLLLLLLAVTAATAQDSLRPLCRARRHQSKESNPPGAA